MTGKLLTMGVSLTRLRTLQKYYVIASTMFFMYLSWIPMVLCSTSSTTATTTTPAPPFYQTNMFIGVVAGVGGFLAFLILVCIVWRCTCGGK